MRNEFDLMVNKKDLINMGFKPNQAGQIIKESKEYLVKIEGVNFYSNRQVSVVPARIIEKLYHIQVSKNAV